MIEKESVDAVSRLALVARSLNGRGSIADIVEIVLQQGMALLHADGAVFAIEHDRHLLPLSVHGMSRDVLANLGPIPADAPVPIAAAARDRSGIWLPTASATSASFPVMREVAPAMEAWAAIPVELEGELIGVFGFCFRRAQRFDEVHRLYVRTLADMSARPLCSAIGNHPAVTRSSADGDTRVASRVDPAGTPSQIACALLADGVLGGDATGVVIAARFTPDELWFLATAGYLGDVHSNRTIQISLDHRAPLPAAVVSGQPIRLSTRADIEREYPDFAGMVPNAEAAIAIPAIHNGVTLGALGVTFDSPQAFDRDTVADLARLADEVASACLAPMIVSGAVTNGRSRARPS